MSNFSHNGYSVIDSSIYVARGLAEAYVRNICLQMQLTENVYTTPVDCAKEVGSSYELWRGIFFRSLRGITPKIVDIPTEDWIASYLTKLPGLWQSFFSNTIGATLTLVVGYPLDVHIIKLINEWESLKESDLNLQEEGESGGLIDQILDRYRGLGAAWARMMVYFSVYHLLYLGMEYTAPSKSNELGLLRRFILELGADIASYPFGAVQRTQVVEKISFVEAFEENKKNEKFWYSYPWHFSISLGVVLIGLGAAKLKNVYTDSSCK